MLSTRDTTAVAGRLNGSFDNPTDALTHAVGIDAQRAAVMVNGSGPYWHSTQPSQLNSTIVAIVCRDLVLGPELAAIAHEISALESERVRAAAEARLSEAVDAVQHCGSTEDADERLKNIGFSSEERSHLLVNLRLHLLTKQGRSESAAKQAELDAAIDQKNRTVDQAFGSSDWRDI